MTTIDAALRPLHTAHAGAASHARTLVIGASLALLMAATRGQHFASIDALPSASWAVFFLAGALLPSRWGFAAFFALATVLDISGLAAGTVADWCMSPAYWVMLPAYAALWFGGRRYARMHRDAWNTVPRLALVLVATAAVTYAISKGGFYFLSGQYPDGTLAGFLARVPQYFPASLGTLAGYAAVGLGLDALVRTMRTRGSRA
ncbi:hypothetical protein [Cognatilysobacter bugurensis]|uniref:Cobalamin transporter n=1 Tax=Cognatilysobacter bugurensis TaxID=543356 RepID=A0A918T0W1_9GAMM|nr:hypothetical protein [Lysobacter bugurensis]GHA80618.1 hypothetical protein GCM10007067_18120 [Lysobacter bugurensis]